MKHHWLTIGSLQLFAEGAAAAPEGAAEGEAAAPQQTPAQELQAPDPRQSYADGLVQDWMHQAEQARARFPGMDLAREVKDPRFLQLLDAGLDVETAYVALHRERIIPAAMHHAARVARQQLASAIMAIPARPVENGLGSQATAVSKVDVSRLSRQQREDIRRRAAKGEKVTF